MRNTEVKKTFFAIIIVCTLLLVSNIPNALAASTSIGPSPKSGSFGKPFAVDMVVDGHGDKFNAAQATVTLSSNLKIKDLTLGDCNFSYLHTPSAENPSFAGVIISTYSTKCIVYTATLVPTVKGSATLNLSKASVKRYGDAANILSSSTDGFYMLIGTTNNAPLDMKNTSKPGLYTLYLKVTTDNTPVPSVTVTLNTVSFKNKQEAAADNTGTAHFSDIQSGVYEAVVTKGGNKVGETIVNVSGTNHVLTLGIDLNVQSKNPLMKDGSIFTSLVSNPIFLIGALMIGVIMGVGIALLTMRLLNKNKR